MAGVLVFASRQRGATAELLTSNDIGMGNIRGRREVTDAEGWSARKDGAGGSRSSGGVRAYRTNSAAAGPILRVALAATPGGSNR